jgi:hypothetical protein
MIEISLDTVRKAIQEGSADADELGAAYLRQAFPPRNPSSVYGEMVAQAAGIDYRRVHHFEVGDSQLGIVDLQEQASLEERRKGYDEFLLRLESAAGNVALGGYDNLAA